jgi:hypothetical protein
MSAVYPKDCDECAKWDADPNERWKRATRCMPVCFYQQLDPAAYAFLALWSRVSIGERISDDVVQYSIDWPAFNEMWSAYAHAAEGPTRTERRRYLADHMIWIRGEMNSPAAQN